MSVSSDLTWELIKGNHRFLVKRDGATFSGEPFNLTNKHSYKFSGLANRKAIDVSVEGEGVVVSTKRAKNSRRKVGPHRAARTRVNKHMVNKSCRGADVINNVSKKRFYRGDLSEYAVARYHALKKALKMKKTIAKE